MSSHFPSKTHRIPVIDGLRAVSVLWVIASHYLLFQQSQWAAQAKIIFNGLLGVRFFFVISGFIITALLLREKEEKGHLSFSSFYLRRFFRLVPALYSFIIVVGILRFLSKAPQPSLNQFVSAFTFTAGFFPSDWNFGHLWSLNVEEVFYLIWPFVISKCDKIKLKKALFAFIALGSSLRIILHLNPHASGLSWNVLSVFSHFDQLSIGALLAASLRLASKPFQKFLNRPTFLFLVPCLLLIFIPHYLAHLGKFGILVVPFGNTMEALGMALLMGNLLVYGKGFLYRILCSKLCTYLGLLSYSLYLWQELFFPVSLLNATGWSFLTVPPSSFFFLLIVAIISYEGIEKRISKSYQYLNLKAPLFSSPKASHFE